MDSKQLAALPLFEGIALEKLERCASKFQIAEMLAGSSLAKQDDFAYRFFVVLAGEVEVYRDFKHVADLGPGEFFGEMGLLGGKRRNARVNAKTRVDIAWMMPWDFEEMTSELPEVSARIDQVVAARNADIATD